MKVDLYTKAILTVIAATLVWQAFSAHAVTTVLAQDPTPSRVVVVGWEDHDGYVYRLPSGDIRLRTSPGLPLPVWERR